MSLMLAVILGAITGSFLNVVVHRVPRDESVIHPPSHCPNCQSRLGPADLVPALRFLLLGGRCRHCGGLSPRHVIIGLAAIISAVTAVMVFGATIESAAAAVLLLLLVALMAIDLDHFLLPDRVVGAGVVIGLPIILARDRPVWQHGLMGFLAGGLPIAVTSRGGMGGGDIKMAAMIGLYLGWRLALLALGVAFMAGGVVGACLLVAGARGRKNHLPFGPFLALGAAVSLFAGEAILAWYLGPL